VSEKRDFRTMVFENLGRASVCWDELPRGVFDSTKCQELGMEIVTAYGSLMREALKLRRAIRESDDCGEAVRTFDKFLAEQGGEK